MNSSFVVGREHRAHCSIDMLGIGSALYKTPLKRRFGTLGVKQGDSSHIPQPAIAGLGFAPNGVNAFSSPQNFDGLLANLNSRMTR